MRNLWCGAAAIALVSGALTACASPHYPVREGEAAGPPPLTMPKPKYPTEGAAPAVAPAARPAAESAPPPPPSAAPVAPVDSQPLPPLASPSSAPSAAAASSATAASVNTSSEPPPASAQLTLASAPVASGPLAATPVSTEPTPTPTAMPASPAGAPAPAAAAAPPPAAAATPPPAVQPDATPRIVSHDQPAAPPTAAAPAREAAATVPAPQRAPPRFAVAGEVVEASGIFENYEVQRGDHIDELARAFKTTRSVIVEANGRLRPPYRLLPGEILKVPVASAYVAQSGDTLASIGRRFDADPGELAQLNHLSAREPLRAGQRIGLPSSMHDHGPLRVSNTEYAEASPPPRSYAPPSYARASTDAAPPATRSGLTPETPTQPPPTAIRSTPPSGYLTQPPPRATTEAAPALNDSQVTQAAHGRFVWPLHGQIAAAFGPKGLGQRNDGIDIKATQGQSVHAAAAGQVVYAGDQVKGGFGNLVLIEHSDGWFTAYAHLDKISVKMMDHVDQGQEVGLVGMSGDAIAPELHFEIRYHPAPGVKTQPVDPVLALPPA
jgi:murein DD-endopeptidase MepM/ murein hydrolase activator NlpD